MTVTNGILTSLTRQYAQNGGLTVILEPPTAVAGGAQWSIDGSPPLDSGATVSNLSVGAHSVVYKAIAGWQAPTNETVTISEDSGLVLTRFYGGITAGLSIFLQPKDAVAAGARWMVDSSGIWLNTGDTASQLTLGTHVASFLDAGPMWVTPPPQNFTLTDGSVVTATVTYAQLTGLEVVINPPEAVQTGAQWRVNAGSWTNSGVLSNCCPATMWWTSSR